MTRLGEPTRGGTRTAAHVNIAPRVYDEQQKDVCSEMSLVLG